MESSYAKYAEKTVGDIEERLKHEKLIYDVYNIQYSSPEYDGMIVDGYIKKLNMICNVHVPEDIVLMIFSWYHCPECPTLYSLTGDRFEKTLNLERKFKDFWRKKQFKNKKESGFHKTRICIIIDRRELKSIQHDKNADDESMNKARNDRMYIYLPPNNCNTLDDGHIPESYFNLSRECVLPGKGYNNGEREIYFHSHSDNDNMKDIDVGMPIQGYQFTLSFHVEAINDIKCYLIFQGWMTRFFPQDMIEIWPLWFHDLIGNKGFINNQKNDCWKSRMNELQEMLTDDQFSAWYKETTQRDDLLKMY